MKENGREKRILDYWWVQPAMIVKWTEQSVTRKSRLAARNQTPVLTLLR